MFSISGAVQVILTLVVAGLIFWLLNFLIDYIGVPQPFQKVAKVILMVLAVLLCIFALLSLLNGQPMFRAGI